VARESSGALVIDDAALRAWPLPVPGGRGDKEDRGRVVIVAGSREIPGAVVLAATAALRAGAGKVAIGVPASIAQAVAFAVPESRVIALEQSAAGGIAPGAADALAALAESADSLLVGPGLPYDESTCDLTAALLERFAAASIVLDAGAMRVVRPPAAARDGRTRFTRPVLLTPHAGEMASLTGREKEHISDAPESTALEAALEWNAVVTLKGAITHIAAPDTRVWRHEAGNVGLGTSGSGDVLAGLMAGLLARGVPLEQAAAWGVALHARAGERLARRFGELGYLARELAGEVPALMAMLAAAEVD
jgi:ADP-dependent NAD(P)H-hydrate dehydratase